MRYALVGLIWACLLAGSANARNTPDFKAKAHTIAIISLLGSHIETGSGGFGVPNSALDRLSEHLIAASIENDLPGTAIVAVDVPRSLLLNRMYQTHGFGDVGMEQVREALRPWAAEHPVDFIVILRKSIGYPFPRSFYNFSAFGIGLARNDTDAHPNAVEPVALLNMTVLDGKTLEVVTDQSVRSVDWGSIDYKLFNMEKDQTDALIADTMNMLRNVVPSLCQSMGL